MTCGDSRVRRAAPRPGALHMRRRRTLGCRAMTTWLLVPGAGGAAWYWHRVVELLRARGDEAIAVDLPADDPRRRRAALRRGRARGPRWPPRPRRGGPVAGRAHRGGDLPAHPRGAVGAGQRHDPRGGGDARAVVDRVGARGGEGGRGPRRGTRGRRVRPRVGVPARRPRRGGRGRRRAPARAVRRARSPTAGRSRRGPTCPSRSSWDATTASSRRTSRSVSPVRAPASNRCSCPADTSRRSPIRRP